MTTLHSLNSEFAIEHEHLENELQTLEQRCIEYERERQKSCDSCRSLAEQNTEHRSEIDRLSHENDQLVSDINMMKVLIYRLNVQLEHHQEIIRKQDGDGKYSIERAYCHGSVPAPSPMTLNNIDAIDWGTVHSHVLAPLMNAYQETIKEKINLIKQYESELNVVTGRIKDVLTENEELHAQIENLKQLNDTWNSEKVRLQAQVDVCRLASNYI